MGVTKEGSTSGLLATRCWTVSLELGVCPRSAITPAGAGRIWVGLPACQHHGPPFCSRAISQAPPRATDSVYTISRGALLPGSSMMLVLDYV